MNKKKYITLIVSIIFVLILTIVIIGGTFAFFGWRADKESTVDVTVASGIGECLLVSDNNVLLEPTMTKNDGRIIKLKASQEVGAKAYIDWNMVIHEIEGLQHRTFKYEIINTTTGISYGSGNFENVTSDSTISFSNKEDILNINSEYEFVLYLWIDGTEESNPLSMADQKIDFDLNCTLTGTES